MDGIVEQPFGAGKILAPRKIIAPLNEIFAPLKKVASAALARHRALAPLHIVVPHIGEAHNDLALRIQSRHVELILVPLAFRETQRPKKRRLVQFVPHHHVINTALSRSKIAVPHTRFVQNFIGHGGKIRFSQRSSCLIHILEIVHHQIGSVRLLCVVGPLQRIRLQTVVGIHKGQELSRSRIDSRVAGGCRTAVGTVNRPDSGVPGRPLVTQFGAAVGASVVHQQDFQIPEGLGDHTGHAVIQILFRFIHRNDHTDHRHVGLLFRHTQSLPVLRTGL